MATSQLFDASAFLKQDEAFDFIRGVLEASTEYSIIATDLDGRIRLWNRGARRLYGYEPEEVIGRLSSPSLHVEEDVEAGLPEQIAEGALRDGKWEGMVTRRRRDGHRFPARVVTTPRTDADGKPVGFLLISKDVSEEQRLTKELQATQFYTRSLIESNIDALMTTDPLGVITDVNEQMVALTGRARGELIGTRFKDYFTEPLAAEEGIRRVLRDGRVTNYELTARAKNGQLTLVSYNASVFHDEDGKLQGVFAAARDVTQQKDLERRLREQQVYLRGLIEASVDGLVTVDPSGAISDVNDTMCRMTGYSRAELIATPFADYFTDPERASAGVAQTFEHQVVTDYRLTLARQAGEPIEVSFNASVFKDDSGNVLGIFASARDITDQAQLQEQLSEERTYNRGLIEASLDGLITVDPLLVITDVNDTMCAMTGFARQELTGSLFPDYFTDPAHAAAGVRLTLEKGSVAGYELVLRSKDGAERLVSFNAAVFHDVEGKVRGIFASARDVTEQARLQVQLGEERTYNRGLIEASVDGLVTVDDELRITDVNEQMCRMAGRPRGQLIGSPFPGHFEEEELAEQGVRLTLERGIVTDYVLTLVSAAGTRTPVSFNATALRDEEGGARGIFASARDIAAQKHLEQQVQATQFYTRSLIESNIDALMTTDPLGVITDVNQQMEVLTGRSREELIGTPFKTYFTEPDRAEDGIRLVLEHGKVTNYELTARTPDGRETVVSYNASTFDDESGRLQGVFAAARDVTQQKELERQLREQQVYLRGLIEASVDGLVTVDPDGFITDVNETMCRMTGYERNELVGTAFADYFTDPDRARAGTAQTFDQGAVQEYALTLVSRSRRQLEVSFNASVYRDESGNPTGILASARDVTDRARLEEQLRERQSYLRGLIEASVDGLVTVNPEGIVTDVNQKTCEMTGRSREELIGSPFRVHFTDPQRADLGVRQTFADGVVTDYELVLVSASGRKATVSFNSSVFRSPEGELQGIFASARDITAQARLSQQLAEQQVYNRSLIEASADALFAIGRDGVITDVNDAASRLTGYSRRHLTNLRFAELFTDPQRARAGVEQTFAESRVLGYELELKTSSGLRVTVSFNAGVFLDASGNPVGILAAARDITEQKELERQLRSQQSYTRSLIESNIDALMTTDPLGIITDVNQQMEALTGRNRNELVGSPFKDHFTDPDAAEEGIRLVLREGKVTNYELTVRSGGNAETVVSYNASTFFDESGRLQGVFAAARDVTDLKRGEERIRIAREEAERANRAKSEFLSRMSHELRTPLNAILGFTQLLEMDELAGEPAERIGQIGRAGRHLLDLINEVLDISRIEAGQIALSPEPVQLAGVVDEAEQLVRGLCEHAGVGLEVAVADEHWARVDRQRLKQVLLNLVSNAVKYNRPAGSVAIASARVDGSLQVRVSDTGPGIPQDRLPELFVPFNRLGADRTGVEGSGLGLSLSRALAEAMGGRLFLETTSPKGSTFLLEVQATEALSAAGPARAEARERAADARAPRGGRERPRPTGEHLILYIEDNLANVDLLEDVLGKRAGTTLVPAIQGSLGLELARARRPSLVLLDVHLPDLSGEEVLLHLKRDPETASIPVVMLTADAINARPEHFLALGARAHLTKPIDVERLIEVVDTVLVEVEGG
ncbi:MAG: PAS domain S-box protein [Actinomycetota bacterium]